MPFLLRCLSRLPMEILYVVADIIAFSAQYIVAYRRKVVLTNLKNSFPEKSDRQIRKIRSSFYGNLADIMVETLKAITMSEKELRKRVAFHGLDKVNAYYQQQQPILIAATHQCNWEWLLLAGCLYLPYPVDAVYQPLANASMEELLRKTRARFGGMPIPTNQAAREILRRKTQIRATAIVADQVPSRSGPKSWFRFLHQDTAFPRGIEQLSRLTNFPVFFAAMKRQKRGFYKVELIELSATPHKKDKGSVLRNYVIWAEQVIQEQPANWLWSHKRWKYPKPAEEPEG